MTTVFITTVINRETAQPLVDALQGKTYLNFKVGLAPAGGMLAVTVSTDRKNTDMDELTGMLFNTMSDLILSAKQ